MVGVGEGWGIEEQEEFKVQGSKFKVGVGVRVGDGRTRRVQGSGFKVQKSG